MTTTMHFAFALPDYCERLVTRVFGEPINLLTNVAFLVAAFLAYRIVRGREFKDNRYLAFLATMVALIGIGSFIFHAAPSHFTVLFDALPIYIFVTSALALLLSKLTSSWSVAWATVGGFVALEVAATILVPSSFLNGSIRHLLVLVFVGLLLIWCYEQFGKIANGLLLVVGLYGAAIAARSIDQAVCSSFPLGTHFLWHLANATCCFFAVSFLDRVSSLSGRR